MNFGDQQTVETKGGNVGQALVTHRKNCKKLRDLLKDGGWLDAKRKVERSDDQQQVVIGVLDHADIQRIVCSVDFSVQAVEQQLVNVDDDVTSKPTRKLMSGLKKLLPLDNVWTPEMERECLTLRWERHGDMVVLNGGAFQGEAWRPFYGCVFWQVVAECLMAKRLAIGHRVVDNAYRSPAVRLVVGDDPWVIHVDNGVHYGFDVTRCMFSKGNINEKLRISRMDCSEQVVVDMFAGIGYFTLPYLVHAKAKMVHACEWNPDAINALKRNLNLNCVQDRCVIHQGDNRDVAPVGVAQRVNLGLIPSSESSWESACRALHPDTGGILHVHANVTCRAKSEQKSAYAEEAERVRDAIETIVNRLNAQGHGKDWHVIVNHVVKVKWYAPHVQHLVFDIECK